MLSINNKTLKYGLVGLMALVLIVSGIDYTITQIKISKIPQDLRINTDKDNIIGAQTIPNGKIYDKQDPKKVIYEGEVVKYAYKTEKIEDKVNEVVEKRTKHSRTVKVAEDNEKITYQLEVISGVPQYYEDEDGEWYQADYGTTDLNTYSLETKGSVLASLFFPNKVYATTGTFYPDADPETSTMDGSTNHSGANWTTVRDAVSSSSANANTGAMAVQGWLTGGVYYLARVLILFDTSSIGSSSIISSATLSIKIESKTGETDANAGTSYIVSSNPATNTNVVVGDYSTLGSTNFGSIAYSSLTATVYADHTLNSSGISQISKTAISKFGVRIGADFSNITPTGANRFDFWSAENAGTSDDPKLVVTYTAPTGNFFQMF